MRRFDADKFSIHAVRDCLMELEREGLQFDAVLASEDVLAVGAKTAPCGEKLICLVPPVLSLAG